MLLIDPLGMSLSVLYAVSFMMICTSFFGKHYAVFAVLSYLSVLFCIVSSNVLHERLWNKLAAVAIAGILAAMVNNYFAPRAQMDEPIALMDGMKQGLADYYAKHGKWPAFGTDIAVTSSGEYTLSIVILGSSTTAPGSITLQATMKDADINVDILSKTVEMQSKDGGRTWTCTKGTGANAVDVRYLPDTCK